MKSVYSLLYLIDHIHTPRVDGGGRRVFLLAYSAHQNKRTSHQQHKGHQPSANRRFGRSVIRSLPISEPATTWANGGEERKPKGEGGHECQPNGAIPGEMDGSIVVESISYLLAGDCYQDDVKDEDYSREERSWQDDCEADDRGEARSTVALGPVDSEVAPPSEKGEKGNDQTEKGEATGDGVEDKGGGQSL